MPHLREPLQQSPPPVIFADSRLTNDPHSLSITKALGTIQALNEPASSSGAFQRSFLPRFDPALDGLFQSVAFHDQLIVFLKAGDPRR